MIGLLSARIDTVRAQSLYHISTGFLRPLTSHRATTIMASPAFADRSLAHMGLGLGEYGLAGFTKGQHLRRLYNLNTTPTGHSDHQQH